MQLRGHEPFEPPDGGWGWLVCLTSFCTNGVIFGTINTFGILYVEMMKEFDDDGQEDLAFKTCAFSHTNTTC